MPLARSCRFAEQRLGLFQPGATPTRRDLLTPVRMTHAIDETERRYGVPSVKPLTCLFDCPPDLEQSRHPLQVTYRRKDLWNKVEKNGAAQSRRVSCEITQAASLPAIAQMGYEGNKH